MNNPSQESAAEPLLELDRKARDLFKPHRKTPVVEAMRWFGQAGDQFQLRALTAGVFALGVLRQDPRMMRAAARMLVSHELATLAKKAVKNRVDRVRPRSASQGEDPAPRAGHSKAKALNSFPSGHSAGATAVACAFADHYPQHRTSALVAAGAVCAVQVPTCSHYPSDVAAGAAIGLATDRAVGIVERMVTTAWRRWKR